MLYNCQNSSGGFILIEVLVAFVLSICFIAALISFKFLSVKYIQDTIILETFYHEVENFTSDVLANKNITTQAINSSIKKANNKFSKDNLDVMIKTEQSKYLSIIMFNLKTKRISAELNRVFYIVE